MKASRVLVARVVGLLVFYLPGSFAQSEPLNYQDCLLFATRERLADTPEKVKYIERSCRERFPDSAPEYQQISTKLSSEALSRVDIWAKRVNSQKHLASVYNGNSDIIVTGLVVLVFPRTNRGSMEDFFDAEEYAIQLNIQPFKTGSFELPVDSKLKGEIGWKILSGEGY